MYDRVNVTRSYCHWQSQTAKNMFAMPLFQEAGSAVCLCAWLDLIFNFEGAIITSCTTRSERSNSPGNRTLQQASVNQSTQIYQLPAPLRTLGIGGTTS
jgi:hypothetical protein